MACSTCNKVSSMNFAVTNNAKFVTGRDGNSYPINSCLVARSRVPRSGWGVVFTINEQTVRVGGPTSASVYRSSKELFEKNDIVITEDELWLNLNIQWLERAVDKHQQVTLAELLRVSETVPEPEGAPASTMAPAVWMDRVWSIVELYLAQPQYDQAKFTDLLHLTRSLANPADNSNYTGNGNLYIILSFECSDIETNPIYGQMEARERLVDIRRKISQKVGLPVLTFEQVAKHNHWE